jgi:hypothetical protein
VPMVRRYDFASQLSEGGLNQRTQLPGAAARIASREDDISFSTRSRGIDCMDACVCP